MLTQEIIHFPIEMRPHVKNGVATRTHRRKGSDKTLQSYQILHWNWTKGSHLHKPFEFQGIPQLQCPLSVHRVACRGERLRTMFCSVPVFHLRKRSLARLTLNFFIWSVAALKTMRTTN